MTDMEAERYAYALQLAAVREGLREFGKHDFTCRTKNLPEGEHCGCFDIQPDDERCDCGLRVILAASAPDLVAPSREKTAGGAS